MAASLARVVAELPSGEVRTGQLEMAEAVAAAIGSGGPSGISHLSVAAGTGTGKSLAYLVPSVLSGKRVVVATATKALQDQLAHKDLPLVAAGLKTRFSWAVLKGRSNYLCRQRLVEMERFGEQAKIDLAGGGGPAERGGAIGEEVARLVAWAEETASGDRAELDFEPQAAAWASVSVSAEECPGAQRCPSGGECFAERARRLAEQAAVVVVNHHLLGADLRSEGAVLPEHDALVADEAHELEDTLAASLGVELGAGRVRGVAAAARASLGSSGAGRAVDDVLEAATRFDLVLREAAEVRLPAGLGGELAPVARLLASRLSRLESQLRQAGGTAGPASEPAQRALRSLLAVERCRVELESCLSAGDETVAWVAGGERRSLRAVPLDVRRQLFELVFSRLPVVLTSATLPPGLAVRLGAEASKVREIDVGSPFDFQRNGLIYCAARLPDRRRPGAEAALHDELEALVLAAGGRTLALFTSYRSLKAAADALRPRVPWPVHVQGDLPKRALVAAFAGEEESCLFATMGFWQGLDVPGATLSLVVIDKIPFPRPDHPLFAARREAAGAQGFRLVDLPRAATLLTQGAGRLIRTAEDRGVVAVLDPRLATASYSGYLVKALPKMRRTKDREVALAFLTSLTAGQKQDEVALADHRAGAEPGQ